jgi:nucleoside-diphosphate-sugar epimerase
VFFLAFDVGGSHYLETYQDSFEFIENNNRIMANTFEVLRSQNKPFIFASSTMANIHGSTYGLLKAVGEKYTNAANGLPVRFWNVYGEESDQLKFHVISDFIQMARTSGKIKMRTTGVEQRDFLFVDDCSQGLEAIMLNYKTISPKENLHLASFKWHSIYQVAEVIAKHFGAEIITGNRGDVVHQGIRTEPDRYLLKYWQPVTTLEQGITKLIERQLQ